ncbi:MAG: hypothetical protein AAFX92_07265 [Pseudomonadota bacterium]
MGELPGNDPQLVVILIFAIGFGLAIVINLYGLWRLIFKEMRYRPGDLSARPANRDDGIDYPAGPGLTGRRARQGVVAHRNRNHE